MDISEAINGELRKIEKERGVRILHAAESGSRAWGFASPDSDYDVRFVYVRPVADYLRVNEVKDVIEWQLDDVMDINGWDLKKALRLCANGNPTLFEWGGSPEVYYTTPEWRIVMNTCRGYFSEKSAVSHYVGTAISTWTKYLTGETVRYKKYFYALRPLLAAIYIERYHKAPPVLFADLLKMQLEPALRQAVDELLERKKVTAEGEENAHMPVIRDFIRDELDRQRALERALPDDKNRDWSAINRCFMRVIGM